MTEQKKQDKLNILYKDIGELMCEIEYLNETEATKNDHRYRIENYMEQARKLDYIGNMY